MISLAWGGLTAGEIDPAILARVAGGTAAQIMERNAAAKWAAMRTACHAATGYWINPQSDGDGVSSCYRTFDSAVTAWVKSHNGGPVAANPYGQPSNHEWARAIDITGYGQPGVQAWLDKHAEEYGYSQATGRASGEAWHYECYTPPATITAGTGSVTVLPTLEEAIMNNAVNVRTTNGKVKSTALFWYSANKGIVHIRSEKDNVLLKRLQACLENPKREDIFYQQELDYLNSVYL